MPASNYVKNKTLDFWFRNQSVTQPTNVYVALYATNPTGADTGTEITGGGYARVQATFTTPSISSDISIIQNTAMIQFPQFTAAAGTALYVGLRDAATGGNLLAYEALPTALVLSQGFTPYWSAGDLKVTVK